jgi:hypothetical protein
MEAELSKHEKMRSGYKPVLQNLNKVDHLGHWGIQNRIISTFNEERWMERQELD